MKIQLKEISIREVTNGFVNNQEEGVVGYGGKLNIRPPYQREFIYKDKQRDAVIETVRQGFPLNTMYWVDRGDDTYEVMDGQQRILSLCQYIAENSFAIKFKNWKNLLEEEKKSILDYKLQVYFCSGTNKEKLEWFEVINIAGEKLTNQELRNAIYTGTWLSDAKRYFSRPNCPAYGMASNYIKGSPIRQDYLETVIKWISGNKVDEYMSNHQHKPNANELWLYFRKVISWITIIFPEYRKEMKGIDFGFLYNEYGNKELDSNLLEKEISELMIDEDVTKKRGIYPYVLTGDEKYLSIRAFSPNQKRESFEKQEGICVKCEDKFDIEEMEGDHITPWIDGGKTISENCQMLCMKCNRTKSNK